MNDALIMPESLEIAASTFPAQTDFLPLKMRDGQNL